MSPHLERAHLRDAVLDVVERILEDVELPVPARHSLALEARPVDAALEPAPDVEPRLVARRRVVSVAARVDPALKRIDTGDVRKTEEDVLEVLDLRRAG